MNKVNLVMTFASLQFCEFVSHVVEHDKKVAHSAVLSIKKALIAQSFFLVGGRDGTRTRDPVRDRHVF
jgi:hypothetical protein